MVLESLLPLILFTVVATVTPGGATTMIAASGAHFGVRRSLPLLAGIAAGLASMAAAASTGLAGALLALPSLQWAMKITGTLYLLWLAWKISRNGAPRAIGERARPVTFVGGVWMLWHNPKGWAMTMGAAASFGAIDTPLHMAVTMALAFGMAATASLMLWCLAGQMLARVLRSERQWRAVNSTLGLLLAVSIVPMWLE